MGDGSQLFCVLIGVPANLAACQFMYGVGVGWCPLAAGLVCVGWLDGTMIALSLVVGVGGTCCASLCIRCVICVLVIKC